MQKQERKDIYRDFCQKAQLPIFVQDWYLDAVCQGGTWDFVFVELDGRVVAVQPYFLKNKFGFSYITMPLLAKFMGPFLLPEVNDLNNQHLIYEKLIAQLPKVHSFRQNFYPDVKNWLPFYWNNYEQTTRYTYRLNVENLEAVYRSFSKSTKYKIRKAAKELEITEEGTATQFYETQQMTFDRQGLKMKYNLSQFLEYDRILAQHNVRKIFFAIDKEKKIHAALYFIQDNGIAYYHLSGSNPQLRKSEAGIFLIWHLIQYTKEQLNINILDFEGSMIKSIESVWRRVRAEQTPYFSIKKDDSKLFKFIQKIRGRDGI